MSGKTFEVNFDGLVGPTHNYGGLAYGNVASMGHGLTISNPRAAVRQGIEKMKLLADMGLKQAVLPPHERPDLQVLRRLGFTGNDFQFIESVGRDNPDLLAACYSSSGMWTANAATVSPGVDTADKAVHLTPANLTSQFHRSLETRFTGALLRKIFADDTAFAHHDPLPAGAHFCDEGAANHVRLARTHGAPGIEIFVYGKQALERSGPGPQAFPARQTLEASQAVCRLHRLAPSRTMFVRQNPDLIDAGVFHNDVICVGNENVLLYHADAFSDAGEVLHKLKSMFHECCETDLIPIQVNPEEVTVTQAIETYLFNSQLVTLPDGTMRLAAPTECEEHPDTKKLLGRILEQDNPITRVHFVDTGQSMKNGGGPACLRLRVVLSEHELDLTHQGVFLTDLLYQSLIQWANHHYRDRLSPEDLLDPFLLQQSRAALDELTQMLGLGPIYGFQKVGA